jgi:hypothetical protein
MNRSVLRPSSPRVFGVELFCKGPVERLPEGVVSRNAREILDRDVAFYRHEFDGPSPSLHSNYFRYALLEDWADGGSIRRLSDGKGPAGR